MLRQSSPPQIHQEKREIVQDVRAGNLVVELDAVEQRRSPVQQHDVAQMEIAVTLPNETGLAPAFEHLRTAIELAARSSVTRDAADGSRHDRPNSANPAAFPSTTQDMPALPP